MLNQTISAIIVPQGAEYKAVCRGLSNAKVSPPIFSVPVGSQPLRRSLENLKREGLNVPQPQVLLMGLCGSLSSRHQVGDIVLYQSCEQESQEVWHCDEKLTHGLEQILKVRQVKALTTDRVICTSSEKQDLGQQFDAEVVDMEGAIVLESLSQVGISVAMLRVVSDNCRHDIPNLNAAIRADGSLNAWALATQFLKEPIAAVRLIQGAMQGLDILQSVTTALIS